MDKNHTLITIAIPTYNRADGNLRYALGCAVKQTYPNIDIIVSDNCSSDHTEDLVKSFADPRIRYFKQSRNIGPNNNFNFCVERAKGDYFLLLHDDDLVDDDFVEACVQALNGNTDVGLVRTGTRVINAEGRSLSETPNKVRGLSTADFFLSWFAKETALYLCSTLFNTRRLREIGGFQTRHNLLQDVVAEFILAARFGRVEIRDVKASFRRHPENMGSSAKIDAWSDESLHLLDTMCQLAPVRATQIRRAGLIYFCRMNYRFVLGERSFIRRCRDYLLVYKRFHYCQSPVNHIYKWEIRPKLRGMKRAVGKRLFGISAR